MSETLEKTKRRLWRKIQRMEDPAELRRIEESIQENKTPDWREAVTVLEDKTLDEIMCEQNYKPVTAEEFFAKAREIDIQEPLDYLLAQLD